MPAPDPSAWVVHKFGGSSVADAECFKRVANILESLPAGRLGVVLSACRGVTDGLLGLVARAEAQDDAYRGDLDALRARHATIAQAVLTPAAAQLYMAGFDRDRHDIEGILHTVKLTRSAAQNVRDLIAGYGEIWSTKLFREFFASRGKRPGEVRWIDAREAVVVEWGPLGPGVQWDESRAKLKALVPADFKGTLIITGFIASDRRGVQTTLGRNGSDFSGSIFGALLDSSEIHIWTDVDGVLSADPRRVPDAKVIDSLSYNEAMELAYFGAKVIHPQTMAPAVGRGIPIWIRNTFAPGKPGSLICAKPDSKLPVKGITSIENIAMVNVEGAGMIGVPGTAHRLFGALREEGISVILISQGSSEHSICCAIPGNEAERAARVVAAAFDREVKEGQIQSIQVDRGLAILAVVGDGMAGLPGISGQVFNALGSASVNVHAIAQGASERNISVVVDGKDTTRALRAVHSGFYLSPHTISIGLIGPGAVGRVLLEQIAAERERLLRDFKLDLRVRALMTSRKMLLSEQGVDLNDPNNGWRSALDASTTPADIAKFAEHLHVDHLPHTIIIDCTADEGVAKHYADWLKAGIHVVTPNKKANSGPLAYYESLKDARKAGSSSYLYEATVGAGLPVISTLRDLRETGDKLASVEGIFSGTLAYLFNVYDGKKPFSEIVKDAKAKGYTEPDPRDDLSGTDFVRKVIILGREMGLKLEMKDVQVESLIPPGLEKGSIDDFLAKLPQYDDAMKKRFDAAAAKGKVLRYMGQLTADGKASVGVRELDRTHAFANIALTDNVVRYATARYNSNPLIVQGPGAGPEVTAAGVFADLLRVCSYLGAHL
ncbi:MAG TPA: bifunctional aspartate kinase/homoserine dehydrogenase I [Steroidobacteraceae bacterium]|nr:bifunctional aspartate kinase/homoserine dehydrogenase I [Steroidobacteraceae bacterium]